MSQFGLFMAELCKLWFYIIIVTESNELLLLFNSLQVQYTAYKSIRYLNVVAPFRNIFANSQYELVTTDLTMSKSSCTITPQYNVHGKVFIAIFSVTNDDLEAPSFHYHLIITVS